MRRMRVSPQWSYRGSLHQEPSSRAQRLHVVVHRRSGTSAADGGSMKDLPHHYPASARGSSTGIVTVTSPGLASFASGPPSEFGGSGMEWSPETLLSAAVADCFILTFRAIARASKLSFEDLACDVDGELDRVDGQLRFTRFVVRARLVVPAGGDEARARALLEKAERGCLVSRSLLASTSLEAEVVTG
jgi:organic hydroperoxide reductase OsmC/OhrA